MTKKDYLILLALGICMAVTAAMLTPGPDYMDAAYYYVGGLQLVEGHGFNEPFVWNYLDNPQDVLHASHTYWMPLASLVSAVGMWLTGSDSFFSARSGFILLTCLTPILAVWVYVHLVDQGNTEKRRCKQWFVGLLALFSGFYSIYMTVTETFTLYIVFGGVFFVLGFGHLRLAGRYRFLLLGATAGLMHLARADGILWLFGTVLVVLIDVFSKLNLSFRDMGWPFRIKRFLGFSSVVLIGYLLIMAPWYIRNIDLFGNIFPPGGARTMWLTDYDQIFSYHPEMITYTNWISTGWDLHIRDRLSALRLNISTLGAVQCSIVLAPFWAIGLWKLRRAWWLRFMVLLWLAVMVLMTVIFPYSGGRGGYFHAGAGFQLVFWGVAVEGFDSAIQWGGRKRGWNRSTALRILGGGLIGIVVMMTIWLFNQRVIGGNPAEPAWNAVGRHYLEIDESMRMMNVGSDALVMVKNPPSYYAASRRSGVVIPYGDIETTLKAARKFNVGYLILEEDHVNGLDYLYHHPEEGYSGLVYLKTIDLTHIFAFGDGN